MALNSHKELQAYGAEILHVWFGVQAPQSQTGRVLVKSALPVSGPLLGDESCFKTIAYHFQSSAGHG